MQGQRVSYSCKPLSAVLLPGTEKSPRIISTEQGNISAVQHSHFLQWRTSGKMKKKIIENGPVWGDAVLRPPPRSASDAWMYGTVKLKVQKGFLGSYIGYFLFHPSRFSYRNYFLC